MPAKFGQLNKALTERQRALLNELSAAGLNEMATMDILFDALDDYWRRFQSLTLPLRLVPNVTSKAMMAAAEDRRDYEVSGEVGVGAKMTPVAGSIAPVRHAEALGRFGMSPGEKAEEAAYQKRKHKRTSRPKGAAKS